MSRTRNIVDVALMLTIGLVLNLATFPSAGVFGRISFVYLFCYLSGAFLGPWLGMLVAICADILGYFLIPNGVFVYQISLANGLMALFAGLAYKHIKWKHKELTIIPAAIVSFFLLTLGLAAWGESVYLYNIYPYTLAKTVIAPATGISSPYLLIAMSKAITQPLWIAISLSLSMVIIKRMSIVRAHFINSLEYYKAEIEGSKVNKEKEDDINTIS